MYLITKTVDPALLTPSLLEVARYAGYKALPTGRELESLEEALSAVKVVATPRFVARELPLHRQGDTLLLEQLPLLGQDIRAHLEGSKSALLLAMTLGAGVDRLIRATSLRDMTGALLLDAAATALVEALGDWGERMAANACGDRFLTWRYSPGYGDWALSCQGALLAILDAHRKIGLSATETALLTPQKSVTALLGITERPNTGKRRGCATCNLYETCNFRKDGVRCGTSGAD